ncbi:hypothetical protein EGI22_21030 [Lacihabitans sp. LS3-19]|nr:hypothetical protein [Lacihabitans sp. LS3-19]
MITTLLAASLMLSCNPKEILEPVIDFPAFVVIDGDTVKTRDDKSKTKLKYANYEFAPIYNVVGDTAIVFKQEAGLKKPSKVPKLDKIKNNEDVDLKGKPFRIVAIGDGVLTGYRDGGLFNEGMLTSLPNLLANQMGVEFNQPYFDTEDYSGFNRRVRTNQNFTGGPIPKYKVVLNNSGIETLEKNNKAILKSTKTVRIDNYATPNVESFDQSGFGKRIAKDYAGFSFSKMPDIIKANKADFYIIHDVFQGLFESYFNLEHIGGSGNSTRPRPQGTIGYKINYGSGFGNPGDDYSQRIEAYIKLKENKSIKRGVILNKPDLFDAPYLNLIKVDQIKAAYELYGILNTNPVVGMAYVLPTGEIDSLLGKNVHPSLKKGINKNNKLNERNFISFNNSDYTKNLILLSNQETESLAKELNIPVVDIYSLYKAIHRSAYISDDGQKVTVEAFYSSDGFYPSAYGQAIITNETIKVINRFYSTDIPLIDIRPFNQK